MSKWNRHGVTGVAWGDFTDTETTNKRVLYNTEHFGKMGIPQQISGLVRMNF